MCPLPGSWSLAVAPLPGWWHKKHSPLPDPRGGGHYGFQRVVLCGQTNCGDQFQLVFPKAQILGPLLLFLYISAFPTNWTLRQNSLLMTYLFFFTNVTDNNDSSTFLNNDRLFLSKWVHNWKMLFNPDPSKTDQEVIFSTKKQIETHPIISWNNIQVETASYQKHLDLIQCQLSFSNISDMDKVKNAFAARMVSSSELHFTNSAKEPTWVIRKQVSFRYFCIFLHLFRLLCNKHLKTVKPERTI